MQTLLDRLIQAQERDLLERVSPVYYTTWMDIAVWFKRTTSLETKETLRDHILHNYQCATVTLVKYEENTYINSDSQHCLLISSFKT